MNGRPDFPLLPLERLLRRLADDAAGLTVVTPNQRLSAALAREFDVRRMSEGAVSWESADILPVSAFVERMYEDALYCGLAERLPLLVSAHEEQVLWEEVIRGTQAGRGLLSPASAASLARKAWQVAQSWRLADRLRGYPANDDAQAFADWAWRYAGVTERDRLTERARLPDVVAPCLAHSALRKPRTLALFGFDMLTRQLGDFLGALAQSGVEILAAERVERPTTARRVAFASAREELTAAARWARSRLDAAPSGRTPRIGVVVPDLERSRETVRRIFAQTLAPARALAREREESEPPFNISLGAPLASQPIVGAALLAMELGATADAGSVDFERVSRLLRSPFLAGSESELASRARLDAVLRDMTGAKLGLRALLRDIEAAVARDRPFGAPACPVLARRLNDLSRFARDNLHGVRRAGEWARIALSLLDALGFPGERALDSVEHQALQKLHETLAGFTALDRVAGRMRFVEALERFSRMAAEALFQTETRDVAVQILGVLESAGMEFDHLWVAGLTDEAWPLATRPTPLVPIALQRSAGVPEASPAAALELDARITRGWLCAAGEVIVSHPRRKDDRNLAPSVLVLDVPEISEADLGLPPHVGLAETIRRAGCIERLPDFRAPPVRAPGETRASVPVAGGTGVFRDQASCPFRAFATHRLRARALRTSPSAPDASDRGTLLHALLAKLWGELKSKAVLDAASERDLDAALGLAADHALRHLRWRRPGVLEGRLAELERTRLIGLARDWLAKERERAAFEVVAIEQKRALGFGGITVNARLDRMDRVLGQTGGHVVLDYKTGEADVSDWLGERPSEPQLPLYALGADEGVSGLAFACVKAGAMEFRGVAAKENMIPGVKPITDYRAAAARGYRSWDELLASWRSELETLGREFASGEASVRPKDGDETCRHCDLRALCRIGEREIP